MSSKQRAPRRAHTHTRAVRRAPLTVRRAYNAQAEAVQEFMNTDVHSAIGRVMLSLHTNHIVELPDELGELHAGKSLFRPHACVLTCNMCRVCVVYSLLLHSNQLHTMPRAIVDGMSSLAVLSLNHNEFDHVPSAVANCVTLQEVAQIVSLVGATPTVFITRAPTGTIDLALFV